MVFRSSRVRRRLAAGMVAIAVAPAVQQGVASADPPVSGTISIDRHTFDTTCGFSVDVHRVGTLDFTIIDVQQGERELQIRHQEFTETFTNLATGTAVTARVLRTDSSWVDLVGVSNADGTTSFFHVFHGVYRIRLIPGYGAFEVGAGLWVSWFQLGTDGVLRAKGFASFTGNEPEGVTATPSEICALIA